MAAPTDNDQDFSADSWFADIIGDGSNIADQLQAVKDFAYKEFDRLDGDGNGFLSYQELENAYTFGGDLSLRQRSFLKFLLENHDQIAESHDDGDAQEAGLSREDLESYFELIATLL